MPAGSALPLPSHHWGLPFESLCTAVLFPLILLLVYMSNGVLALLLQELEPAGVGSDMGELWQDIDEGLREQAARLSSDLALSHQENRELQERLMVSEATVHAQAEQLKDYRDLLSESHSGVHTCYYTHKRTKKHAKNLIKHL